MCMFQFGLRISELKGCKTSDTDCLLIGVSLPPTCFTKCKSESVNPQTLGQTYFFFCIFSKIRFGREIGSNFENMCW